jgi:hypothetical protein
MYLISYQYTEFTLLHDIRLGLGFPLLTLQPPGLPPPSRRLPSLPPGGPTFPPGGGLLPPSRRCCLAGQAATPPPRPPSISRRRRMQGRRRPAPRGVAQRRKHVFTCAGRPRRAAPARVTLHGAATARAGSTAAMAHAGNGLGAGPGFYTGMAPSGAWPAPPRDGRLPPHRRCSPALLAGSGTGGPSPRRVEPSRGSDDGAAFPIGRGLPHGAPEQPLCSRPSPPPVGELLPPWTPATSPTRPPPPHQGDPEPPPPGSAPSTVGRRSRPHPPWLIAPCCAAPAGGPPWRGAPKPPPSVRCPPLSLMPARPSPSLAARMPPHWPWARPSPSPASQATATGSARPCVCFARFASLAARAGVLSLVSITSTSSTT